MRRKKIRLRYKKERVLFSDVLPYEIPFIFTNRYFYRFLVKNKIQIDGGVLKWDKDIDKGARLILSCLFQKQSKDIKNKNNINVEITSFKSIPFIYNILHKPNKCRLLSIIHPANQMMIVDFYNKYKNSILYLCSKSHYSIRFPQKVACYFYYKDRLHHVLLGKKTDKMEMFFSEYENLRTFFSYKKYTNIYKFYEDYRYQRAEKKFQHLMKFDIQSCFDSIYTHSIAWAISGGVDLYKDNFEGIPDKSLGYIWDKIMQEMNYNETNGIVIGPEFSRIFAEVILQHVDQRVEQGLLNKGFILNPDYECYRYVDDYFFFYNNEEVHKKALELFEQTLKEFKLNISNEKNVFYERPFITNITKAKLYIDNILNENFRLFFECKETNNYEEEEPEDFSQDELLENQKLILTKHKIEEYLSQKPYFKLCSTDFCKKYKTIISDNEVQSKDVVNYTMARIYIKVDRILKRIDKIIKPLSIALIDPNLSEQHHSIRKQIDKEERILAKFLFEILDSVFFIYAMNKRVNTTLKVLQILNIIIIYLDNKYTIGIGNDIKEIKRFSEYIREIVFKKIRDEISLVFQTAPIDDNTQLETLYFLIILKQMNTKYQLNEAEIKKYLKISIEQGVDEKETKSFPSLNALSSTILLYYFGNRKMFMSLKSRLIYATIEKISNIPENRVKISAEYIILALDLAACPFIRLSDKRKILQKIGLSRKEADEVIEYLKYQKFMFTRWTGVDITKELNAKISQEVYS